MSIDVAEFDNCCDANLINISIDSK